MIFIFLFGGSGLSIDVSKCCDKLAGISIGFTKSAQNSSSDVCCPTFKNVAPEKACCENLLVNTVINLVPAIHKSYQSLKKPIDFISRPKVIASQFVLQEASNHLILDDFDGNYPIPILLKKRVLTI